MTLVVASKSSRPCFCRRQSCKWASLWKQMKRFFTAKSIWQHTKLIFHRALNMNSFYPSALTSLVVECSVPLGAFRHCDFLRRKPRVWMVSGVNDLFLQSSVLLHSLPWCHHGDFPRVPPWEVAALVLTVHQNEIWSESVEPHLGGILYIPSYFCPWSLFNSTHCLSVLYIRISPQSNPRCITATPQDIRRKPPPSSGWHVADRSGAGLCVRRIYSISKPPSAMSTRTWDGGNSSAILRSNVCSVCGFPARKETI